MCLSFIPEFSDTISLAYHHCAHHFNVPLTINSATTPILVSELFIHWLTLNFCKYLCIKLFVCLSTTLITRLGLLVSIHQVPNMKPLSSAYSKFVTMSSCMLPFTLQCWTQKVEQHFFENHSRQCSSGRVLDLQTKGRWFESSCWLFL